MTKFQKTNGKVKMKEKNEDNKDCPACHGKGKLKTIKPFAHFGRWHIGKETYDDPCFFSNLKEYDPLLDNEKDKKTLN